MCILFQFVFVVLALVMMCFFKMMIRSGGADGKVDDCACASSALEAGASGGGDTGEGVDSSEDEAVIREAVEQEQQQTQERTGGGGLDAVTLDKETDGRLVAE